MTDQAIPRELVNFRAVTGVTADGQRLRPGSLYRSAGLDQIGAPGRLHLHDLGVYTVLDLRTAEEMSLRANDLAGLGIAEVRVPLVVDLDGNATKAVRESTDPLLTLEWFYEDIVENATDGLREVFDALTRVENPVVLVCTAGKDRTGVVVALLQLALGIQLNDVIAGYAESEAQLNADWIATVIERFKSLGMTIPPEATGIFTMSPPSVMLRLVETITDRYGSMAQYFEHIGISHGVQTILRGKFLEDHEAGTQLT